MSPGQNNLPSKSIKEVPGRSKLRVESINPVPTGNPIPKSSKVKLISPEEAIKLSSGITQLPLSPKPKYARATPQVPRPFQQSHRTLEPQRPLWAPPTFVPTKPVSVRRPPEAPRSLTGLSALEAPRPVSAHPPAGSRKEIVCGLQAFSQTTQTVRQKKNKRRTNPSHLQAETVEPPSPRALQIRSRVKQQAATNATQVVQGTTVEVGAGAKDFGSKENLVCLGTIVEVGTGDTAIDHGANKKRKLTSDEEFSELLLYRPALHSTWKGRIVDSATPPEFDCEFWGKPASNISKKAHRHSTAMPTLLEVELLPLGQILNDLFGRIPTLSNVQVYLFPDEKKTERFNGEHARLFDAMETRNAMINVPINGTELLIFSSKLLDETSQFLINTQKKAENFLWGFFLQTKKSVALVPGTCSQADKDLIGGDVVGMDLDAKYAIPPSLALKLIAESQSIPSISPEKEKSEASLPPPGFEMPLVKLNVQGTSDPKSELSGMAGLVRDRSGKWVFGYSRSHKGLSEVLAGLVAIYEGLKLLWDSGFRKIRLEITSLEILNVLTTNTNLFPKKRSILDRCKELILKDWECDICHITKEENSCAEWLASKVEEEHQGLVFFEYPPPGLMARLEKDRLPAI